MPRRGACVGFVLDCDLRADAVAWAVPTPRVSSHPGQVGPQLRARPLPGGGHTVASPAVAAAVDIDGDLPPLATSLTRQLSDEARELLRRGL